jgi:4,5-DOPA dioxygenase extradiol
MLPSLFVSHGSPTLPFDDCPARDFLRGLSAQVPKPSAILAVSAHWDTAAPMLNAVERNDTIHDFYGFPKALYELSYTPPGSAALAERTAELLKKADLPAQIDTQRGLDHGAWVPLMLAWPAADIPVVQLSIQSARGARHHIDLGRALKPLREDVLILASGSFVHNLRAIAWNGGPEPDWSKTFSDWMDGALNDRRDDDLARYCTLAPGAVMAHPTDDHLMPLLVAYGAGDKTSRVHSSLTFGSLRMDAYRFD